jgi:hypothetical protein
MNRRTVTALLFVSILLVGVAILRKSRPAETKADPTTADDAFEALLTEFSEEKEQLVRAQQVATDETKKRYLLDKLFPEFEEKFGKRFLEFAHAHADDPRAVDAAVWICTRPDSGPATEAYQKEAVDFLLEHQQKSQQLTQSLQRITFSSAGKGGERLLRALAERSTDRTLRGMSLVCLGIYFRLQSEKASYQKRSDAAALAEQGEAILEQAARDYAEVKLPNASLGDWAKGELYNSRTLAIGKVAPETEGEDSDGTKFKLSEYRGKVVLLSFWGFW